VLIACSFGCRCPRRPLRSRHRRRRRGASLAELLVALTLMGVVLGTATSTLLRQRRTAAVIGGAAASGAQLRAALGALGAELSALGASAGDVVPGEARDTALQLRALVTSGVSCDDAVGLATFADEDDGPADALSSAAPKTGDTLWWNDGTSDGGWQGRRIGASDSVAAPCPLTGSAARPARRVVVTGADSIRVGAHLRVTRPVRYSIYRSGDGSWQLGVRDWIVATGRFAPPQPVAGPFVLRAGRERSGFRYFDAEGAELAVGPQGADAGLVARIRITAVVVDRSAGVGSDTLRRDSVDVALQRTRGP
jgi:type II secretory pathway pseudopilin PulG